MGSKTSVQLCSRPSELAWGGFLLHQEPMNDMKSFEVKCQPKQRIFFPFFRGEITLWVWPCWSQKPGMTVPWYGIISPIARCGLKIVTDNLSC